MRKLTINTVLLNFVDMLYNLGLT